MLFLQVNFIICELVALLLGFFFRIQLSPTKVSPTTRHVFQVVIGLSLTYFCFGSQILHLFAQTFVCYFLMHTLRPGVMEKVVLLVAMSYLAMCHIYRVVYDYGGYTLDITGPLMVNTQRLSCLAFSLTDGSSKDESKLSPTLKYHASKKWPGLLEFCSYILCFSTCMCGPVCFYQDYIAFIEGTGYDAGKKENDKIIRGEPPSPVPAMLKTLVWAALTGAVMMIILPRYPIPFMKGQAVNLSSGLGYNKKDKDGNDRWDLMDNADIVQVEMSTSLKMLLDNWNKTTSYWLRYVVYERVHSTLGVFFVSAFWHGFYSGYYLTFMTGAVFINTSRLVRRKIRPWFQKTPAMAFLYDILTFITTRIAIAYLVFPFVFLEFWPSLETYASMYYWFHIIVGAFMVVLPLIHTSGSKPSEKKTQ
ncbi:hypothetical protein LSH36_38g07031 [Paralvinella palmiformis]|uniref:Uncharacterized protein n=1 Tax=Paralvinella palmiformis TaxID=53620 RepID=A0AAD9K9V3_9ANNE|nr:hypothetical protein LSH36_38g07031 [Paralvinella palmiformis]